MHLRMGLLLSELYRNIFVLTEYLFLEGVIQLWLSFYMLIAELLRNPMCNFVLHVGNRKLVKRKEFEQYLAACREI